MYRQADFPCVLQGFVPFRAAALLPLNLNHTLLKQGTGTADHSLPLGCYYFTLMCHKHHNKWQSGGKCFSSHSLFWWEKDQWRGPDSRIYPRWTDKMDRYETEMDGYEAGMYGLWKWGRDVWILPRWMDVAKMDGYEAEMDGCEAKMVSREWFLANGTDTETSAL